MTLIVYCAYKGYTYSLRYFHTFKVTVFQSYGFILLFWNITQEFSTCRTPSFLSTSSSSWSQDSWAVSVCWRKWWPLCTTTCKIWVVGLLYLNCFPIQKLKQKNMEYDIKNIVSLVTEINNFYLPTYCCQLKSSSRSFIFP